MKRKFLKSLLALSMCFCTAVTCLAADITLKIDGNVISSDIPPQIIDGRTLVPLRVIAEALGAEVSWDANTKKITTVKDGVTVVMTIGSTLEFINESNFIIMDVAPQIINGSTFVPAKYAAESFGYIVNWDSDTKTVNITKSTEGGNNLGINSERFTAVKEVFEYYLNEIENGSQYNVKNYIYEAQKINSGYETKFQECYDNAESSIEQAFVKGAASLVGSVALTKRAVIIMNTEEFNEYYQNTVDTAWKFFDASNLEDMNEILEEVNDILASLNKRQKEILKLQESMM